MGGYSDGEPRHSTRGRSQEPLGPDGTPPLGADGKANGGFAGPDGKPLPRPGENGATTPGAPGQPGNGDRAALAPSRQPGNDALAPGGRLLGSPDGTPNRSVRGPDGKVSTNGLGAARTLRPIRPTAPSRPLHGTQFPPRARQAARPLCGGAKGRENAHAARIHTNSKSGAGSRDRPSPLVDGRAESGTRAPKKKNSGQHHHLMPNWRSTPLVDAKLVLNTII